MGWSAALAGQRSWFTQDGLRQRYSVRSPNNFVESYNPKADPAALIDQPGERYEGTLTVF